MIVLITFFLLFYVWLAIREPLRALQLLILLLPSYLLRFTFFGIPLTVLEGMILLFSAVIIVRVTQKKQSLQPLVEFIQRHRMFAASIALFVLAGIAGTVIAEDTRAALGIFKAYLVEPLLVFGVVVLLVQESRHLRQLILAAIGCGVLIAIYGIIQWTFPVLIPEPWNAKELFRVTSFYEYPNAVGLIIGPLLILTITMLFYGTSNRKSIVLLAIAAILLAVVLFLSKSQGAWAGVAIALLIGILRSRARLLGIGLLMLFGIALLLEPIREHILPVITFTDVSGEVRRVLWIGTLRLLQEHWIWGVGLSGFPDAYNLYREARHVELLQYPHNIVLNFWVEMGIAGALSMIGLFIVAIRFAIRSMQHPEKIAALGMLIVILVHGLVDVPFFKNDLAVLWWMTFYLAMCSVKIIPTRSIS